MCGICGFSGQVPGDKEAMLKSMNESIYHRGPDEDGFYLGDNVGLAMRRLSILDIDHGSQPIFNKDGNICTVFNGEIYNYPELREEMSSRGYQFNTNVDTEVIVYLYEEYGEEFVKHLRGMFAIALWDENNRKLIVARDQVGIKPLYYATREGALYFGSELKALVAANQFKLSISEQAVDTFLTFMFIPAPLTIYNEIKKLEPGHYIRYAENKLEIIKYWDLKIDQKKGQDKSNDTESVLVDSIKKHLQSDVPMGAFVSGGIDSSLVAAIASQNLKYPLSAFTVFFKAKNNSLDDERPYVYELARKYNINVNELTCEQDFLDIADEIIDAFDEPFGDDSVIPNYYICQYAAKDVKVVLSGLGGDELFAGYRRHNGIRLASWVSHIPKFLIKSARFLINFLPEPKSGSERIDHIKRFFKHHSRDIADSYFGFLSSIDEQDKSKLYSSSFMSRIDLDKTREFVVNRFNEPEMGGPIDRALYTDLKLYMPDQILTLSDRLSMHHSLEIRVPLADKDVIEHCVNIEAKHKIKGKTTKVLLKNIARKFVPASIISHRKQGFEPPMAGWLKHEFKDLLTNTLSEKNLNRHKLFRQDQVNELIEEHLSGRRKNNKILFCLLMFQLWYQRHEDLLQVEPKN